MPKINEGWIVPPHGPLEQLDDGLLTVAAEIVMPLGRFPRRMTVVGLRGGRTAIWSAIPLAEPAMREIEALGEPAILIVPGIAHRLDLKAWQKRYPAARILCPPGAHNAVEAVAHVAATTDILDDPDVDFVPVPGTREREAALVVRREGGTTLVLNDLIGNIRHPHGLGAHIMARLLGFGVKRPQIPRTGGTMLVKDRKALAAGFRRWATDPDLRRIVVSHGDVIDERPRETLERLAAELAG